MKKKSIIRVLETINSICMSYGYCQPCVLDGICPYSALSMANTDNVDKAAEIIMNTIDTEKQDNGKVD